MRCDLAQMCRGHADRQTDRRRPPRREGRTKRLTSVPPLTLRRATTTASPHHPATSSSHQAPVPAYSLPPASPPPPPRSALSPPCAHASRPLLLRPAQRRCSLSKTTPDFLVVVVDRSKLVSTFHLDSIDSRSFLAGRFCCCSRALLLPRHMLAPAAPARPPACPACLHLRACTVAPPCC